MTEHVANVQEQTMSLITSSATPPLQVGLQRSEIEVQALEKVRLDSIERARIVQLVREHINLPSWYGRTAKGLMHYNLRWQLYFESVRISPADDDFGATIKIAATYLKGRALTKYAESERNFTSWDDYINFLRAVLGRPADLKADAILELFQARQRPGQPASEFRSYIQQLQFMIPPMSEAERKAWDFLNRLRPDTRAAVLRDNEFIFSEDQVTESAFCHEGVDSIRLKWTHQEWPSDAEECEEEEGTIFQSRMMTKSRKRQRGP